MKFKSQVYTQASGSIGGITYSRNKGGMYTRARSTPTNPNTLRQQIARAAMGGMVNMWNTITEANRETWRLYAANTPVLDKLGEMINLSGQQMFNRTNSFIDMMLYYLVAIGGGPSLAPLNDGPTTYNTGEPVLLSENPTVDAGAFAMTFAIAAPASDAGVAFLFVGRPQNPGVKFYKGPYQVAAFDAFAATDVGGAFAAADVTDPENWASEYIPAVGQFLPVKIRNLFADGRLSQSYEEIVEVVAPA
jgi:hypothetical protein